MMSDAIRQTSFGLVEANKAQRSPAPLAGLSSSLEAASRRLEQYSANPPSEQPADLLAASG